MIRMRVVIGALVLATATIVVRVSVAEAQCDLGDGQGAGGLNFEELLCAGVINSMPAGGGDGGVPPAALNLAVYEDSQYVGTRAVVRFDRFHITSGSETYVLTQQRTKDDVWQSGGIFTTGPSKWKKYDNPPHSVTPVKVFMYVPGSAMIRASRTFIVRDRGVSTVGMYLRLSAPSACAIQNYRTYGSPPYCAPSIAHWEFNYWTNIQGTTECFQSYTAGRAMQRIEDYSPIGAAIHGLAEPDGVLEAPDLPQCRAYVHLHTYDHASYFWDCVNCLDFCSGPQPCPTGCGSPGSYERSEVRWCEGNNRILWSSIVSGESGDVDVYDPALFLQTGADNDPTQPVFDICKGLVPGTPCILCRTCPPPAKQPNVLVGPFDCSTGVPLTWSLFPPSGPVYEEWKPEIESALTSWAEVLGKEYWELFEFDSSPTPALSGGEFQRVDFYILSSITETQQYLDAFSDEYTGSEVSVAHVKTRVAQTTNACNQTQRYAEHAKVVFNASETEFVDSTRLKYQIVGSDLKIYEVYRKRALLHEIGHVLGFDEADPDLCTGDLRDAEVMCQIDKGKLDSPGIKTLWGVKATISAGEQLTASCMLGQLETYCGPY